MAQSSAAPGTALIDPALPAADLIARGLAQLAAGERTAESLLVQIGAARLRGVGIHVSDHMPESNEAPEMALYQLLARENPDAAHARYNALVRALVSFERAAESAIR
jgi:hypothetical protein